MNLNNKINFTKQELGKLVCSPDKRQIRFYDIQTRGLAIRVTPAGSKMFVFYRKRPGMKQPTELALGQFPAMSIDQARAKVAEHNVALAKGEDPAEQRRAEKNALHFKELFDLYIEQYAKERTKTWPEMQNNFRRYFSRWANRKIANIKRAEVQAWITDLGENNGKATANRNYDMLRAVISWGKKKDIVTVDNPCIGVDRFKSKSRERFIQPGDEYIRFAIALNKEPNETMRDYFWIALFTGQRASNVMAMRWDQINFDLQTWYIPDTKNGDSLTVPLTPNALDILCKRKDKNNSDWVFSSDRRGRKTKQVGHIVEPKDAWKRILKEACITDLRIHDLRRTMGSYMAIQGVSPAIIGKGLGHRSPQATAIYARLSQDPVRQALTNAQAGLSDATKLLNNSQTIPIPGVDSGTNVIEIKNGTSMGISASGSTTKNVRRSTTSVTKSKTAKKKRVWCKDE